MDKIVLHGMQFRAFHGYYVEEHTVGNDYEVDVEVSVKLNHNTLADDLDNTFNYEEIYAICLKQMKTSQKLIETVALRILDELEQACPFEAELVVRVRKLRPLLSGPCSHAEVVLVREVGP